MRKMWTKLSTTAALAFMLCLTGLVMTGEAQAERFVDNGNGTVTDTVTGLMWTKDANMFGTLNWDDAMSSCSSFSISGIGGWRLPSKDELVDLYRAIRGGHPFTGVQSYSYWSSTISYLDHPYHVHMQYGLTSFSNPNLPIHVWCVRAGQ